MEHDLTKTITACGLILFLCTAVWLGGHDGYIAAMSTDVDPVRTIIIDAGHGGFDGGAVGVGGLVEKEINLSVAQKLESMLAFLGYDTVMTRDEDEALGKEGESIHGRKVSDIKYRLSLLESAPDALLISVHQNFFGGKAEGAQIFYGPINPESRSLAEMLQNGFKCLLQPENDRAAKPAGSNIYLLYHATRPAVMVECGFISNREEAAKLSEMEYQKKLCFVMASGLAEYMAE